MTHAVVLADSVNPNGDRLTTLEVTFPRYVLAEMNTHRAFSRNSASSRAIPVERQIQKVLDHPFIPSRFPVNQTGMSAGQFYEPGTDEYQAAHITWLQALDNAVIAAQRLLDVGVHKQVTNRLLEPFMWHTAIISATEWLNFFELRLALRDDGEPVADPEMYRAARAMKDALSSSVPREVDWGGLHLPLVTMTERERFTTSWYGVQVSASRCARSSYERQHDEEPLTRTIERADSLAKSGHLSPWEHPAYATAAAYDWANFRGWCQGRRILETRRVRGMEVIV
jgi:thymidylate synthase ThyX